MRLSFRAGSVLPHVHTALSEQHRRLFTRCVLVMLLLAVPVASMMTEADPDSLRVFGSYWASGKAASAGLDPYGVQPHTWIYDIHGLRVIDLNLNPPVLLPLFQGFAAFDLVPAARAWIILSSLLFFATAGILLGHHAESLQKRQILWLFAAPAFFDTLVLGQIYIVLFAVATVAWLALSRHRFVVAGLAIGLLVAVKPTFALWPALLLLAGHWRPAVIAALAGAALSIMPVMIYGPQIYTQWLNALAGDHHSMIPTDASIQGYLTRVGMRPAGTAIAAALVLSTSVWVRRRRFAAVDASRIALALTILASPLSWVHYTLMLAPALLDRPWSRTLDIAAVLLCVPVFLPLQAIGGPLWLMALLGGVYLTAVTLIFGVFVARLRLPSRPAEIRPAAMVLSRSMG